MPGKKQTRVRVQTRVILVDEFRIFCEALGTVISMEPDLEFVGSATSAEDAVAMAMARSPDVAVIDLGLPSPGTEGFDGIEATRRIKAVRPEMRMLILAGRMELDTLARAASAGACGFLAKSSRLPDICQAIRTAKEGGMFVERELVASLVERLRDSSPRAIEGGSARAILTRREQEVLTLLGEGLDPTAIARRLGVRVSTCRGHVQSVLVKLGSHTQLEAVVEAVHQGLLPHLAP